MRTRSAACALLLLGACGDDGSGGDDDGGGLDAAGGDAGAGAFTLTSAAFVADGTLPVQYTCDGAGLSPPLSWSGAPAATAEYALLMTTEALDGTKYNWVMFHIPGEATALAEDAPLGVFGVSTDGPELAYYGPCSTGPGLKTYTFTLYALAAAPSFAVPETEVDGPRLAAAIAGVTLDAAAIDVGYTRP